MEFNLEVPQDQFFIRSVSEKGIRINQDYFNRPFIISGQRIVPVWNVMSVDDINEESLQVVFDLQPEVVLIGTGNTQVFLPPATQDPCIGPFVLGPLTWVAGMGSALMGFLVFFTLSLGLGL